jgi:quercetin dioxygenase-like cupin family protein
MHESVVYDVSDEDWSLIRRELTEGIKGLTLLHTKSQEVKLTLTRVEPRGTFRLHSDSYHHLFYCISGTGHATIANQTYELKAGRVLEVPSGIEHSYENTGDEILVLLTVNIRNLV